MDGWDDNGLPMALFSSLTPTAAHRWATMWGGILLLWLFMWDYVAKVHNMRLKSAQLHAHVWYHTALED
jgi:hypothetical protein